MKTTVMALALGVLGATSTIVAGCGKNACERYADSVVAKLEECRITDSGEAGTPDLGPCDDAAAAFVECLDTCLPKFDCACQADPSGEGCDAKRKEYATCTTDCGN